MPSTVGSAKKSSVFEANEDLYDAYLNLTIDEFVSKIPWPEWNDAKLNAEVWEEPKGKQSSGVTSKGSGEESNFEDPEPPSLPFLIRDSVRSWKRPKEVFPNASFTVYEPKNLEFELSVPSPFAECDFFTYFNEVILILQYYASKYGFPVEVETPAFVPTTQGEPWRPWHHIYALCKAGKGQTHKPLYCPFGKYVLRLFYMGSWRRLVIDDKIPCDKYGNCMLPVTQLTGELWPILLMKGLLKLDTATTSTDFPLLSILTGWINIQITAVNKTCEQVWRRFRILTREWENSGEESDFKTAGTSSKEISKAGSSKKDSSKAPDKKNERQPGDFCFLLATLGKMMHDDESLSSSSRIAVITNRDCPLIKANRREPTKMWKRIRWVHWASKRGIWTDEQLMPPYRRVQHVTFERNLSKVLAPDPKQEALMYDVPTEDQFQLESEVLTAESESLFEPEQWADFFPLQDRLLFLNVMMKPSFFSSNFKVTSLMPESEEKKPSTAANPKTAAKPFPNSSLLFSPLLKPDRNEPVLLLCESTEGICLCISLWVFPQHFIDCLSEDELLKNGNASLIVEKFNWKSVEKEKMVGIIKTSGSSSILLNLRPGRHVLKLWLSSDSPYLIDVFSNTPLSIDKSPKIRFLMGSETERIVNYITTVSNGFITLTQKFGKPGLSAALQEFYTTIKPGNDKIIGYCEKMDDFIETFLICILLTLKTAIGSADEVRVMMWALQSLFVNPKIQCELPKGDLKSSISGGGDKKATRKVVVSVKERSLHEILNHPWTPQEIAQIITIQRIFRGFRVRMLIKYQNPARKEFKAYTDRLKKICDVIFAPAKREEEVGKLLRRMMVISPDLETTFKFHEDFSNVMTVDEFCGKIANVEPFAWVPIARFIVACHCDEPVPCSFYFSCNLDHVIVYASDNDTNEEIFRLTNCVSPHYYQSNVKGYTIFACGWNSANSKMVNWRLEMVRMKHFQVPHLCNTMLGFPCHPYAIPTLDVVGLKNFYVPNHKFTLCRCLLRIQKRSLLTLRLSTSFPEVKFVVTISLDHTFSSPNSETFSDKNEVIGEYYSRNGAVLIPSLVLEYVERDPWWGESSSNGDSIVYLLEAFVLDDSWPLTRQEWGVVEAIRVNGEAWKESTNSLQSRKGGSESRRKLTRMSKRFVQEPKTVENPFWLLQVLNDSSGADASDVIVVEEDRSYAESVKAMKILWEEKNPGRWQQGKDLRYKFLYMIYMERNTQEEENFEEEEASEEDVEVKSDDHFKVLLQKMSSFSYLTNDTCPERLHESPRVLPKMPTFALLNKYRRSGDQDFAGKTSESYSTLEERVQGSKESITEEVEENGKNFLIQCSRFRFILRQHLAEESKLSNQLMEEAYEGRLKAIERMAT